MAIKEVLTLEGDDVVLQKLNNVQKKGEESLKSFRDLSSSVSGDAFQKAGGAMDDLSQATLKANTAFRALKPALQAAGLQVGEFGALSKIANTSLLGFGIAASGAVAVGLAKLEESTARTKGRLDDLFGSAKLGSDAFKALQTGAQSLGTTVDNIAPGFEAFRTALDRFVATNKTFKAVAPPGIDLPPALVGNIEKTAEAYTNFIKILRAGRLDTAESTKTATDFSKAIAQTGTVTADALRLLPTGTVQQLALALGKGQLQAQQFINEVALAPIPINKLIDALARFGPQAQEAFDTKAIKSINDELSALFATFNEEFQKLGGLKFSAFLVSELEKFRIEMADTIDRIVAIKQLLSSIEPTTPLSEALEKLRQAAKIAFAPTVTADPQLETQAEEAGKKAAERFKAGFRDAPKPAQAEFVTEQFTELETGAQQAGETVATNLSQPVDLSAQQQQFMTLYDAVIAGAQAAMDRILAIFSQQIPTPTFSGPLGTFTGGGFGEFFAGGGQVHGPGSTTSDSIMAFLSNREWVVNAKAVDFYGSSLFAALNSMRLPRSLLTGVPKLAEGGQVRTGASSLTLVLGGRTFQTTTSDETLTSLRRFAVHSQLASIGRKPGFVR